MEIINQILLIQRITLSIIIILITIILSKEIFKKGNNLDLRGDFLKFIQNCKEKVSEKQSKEEKEKIEKIQKKKFIEWKKYQYNQTFGLVAILSSFSMFVCSAIIIGFRDILVNIFGWIPYLTFLGCDFYIIYRFCKITVKKADERAKKNILKLIQDDSFLINSSQ